MIVSRTMRVVIADDEELARTRMERLLEREPMIEVVGTAANGAEALRLLEQEDPDVLFLDVEMAGMGGFEVLKRSTQPNRTSIVFVTAFEKYAVEAFHVEAVDYLQKPVSPERLTEALQRVRKRRTSEALATTELARAVLALERRQQVLERTVRTGDHVDRLLIKKDGAERPVPLRDVEALESAGNYIRVHTPTATHVMRATISGIEARLDPRVFVRIHRRTIINLDQVREVQPWFWGDSVVITKRGQRYRMSRRFRDGFYARFSSPATNTASSAVDASREQLTAT